jgi:diguanylate cyclase (GGDEF)-like protein/PAS domain S-box-containing protein
MAMNLLALTVFICAIMVIMIAVYTWQFRATNGSRVFSIFMFSMSLYILAYSFELSSLDLPLMLFCNKVEYIGILTFPTLAMIFTSRFTGNDAWINKKNLILIFLAPTIFMIVKVFDDSLHLIYRSVAINRDGIIPLLSFEKGPLYYLVSALSALMVTISILMIINKRRNSSLLYIRQSNIILVASFIMFFFFLVYISGFSLIPEMKSLDLNPFAYTLWGIAISYAIFRYKLFNLVPIARETLIETMADGVLVLDDQLRVVDANPKAQSIFAWQKIPIGDAVHQLNLNSINPSVLNSLEGNYVTEMQHTKNGVVSIFEVGISILWNNQHEKVGYLLVLHDITRRKKIEKELSELSLIDALTGLTNRRGFMVLSDQLVNFCSRIRKNAVLFFIDMDGLKQINDNLGHATGDQALIDMGLVLKNSFRSSDIIARIGGDEFTVLAIETADNSTENMLARLDSQRKEFLEKQKRDYSLRFSVGTALSHWENPQSIQYLLDQSDQAMYEIKAAKKK